MPGRTARTPLIISGPAQYAKLAGANYLRGLDRPASVRALAESWGEVNDVHSFRDRHSLSEGSGMLFSFEERQEQQVWMAGMEIPIDVAWIVDDQVLAIDTLDSCTLTDQSQCPRWTSPAPVDALLEVPAGALDGIEPGTHVTIREDQP